MITLRSLLTTTMAITTLVSLLKTVGFKEAVAA